MLIEITLGIFSEKHSWFNLLPNEREDAHQNHRMLHFRKLQIDPPSYKYLLLFVINILDEYLFSIELFALFFYDSILIEFLIIFFLLDHLLPRSIIYTCDSAIACSPIPLFYIFTDQ